MVNLAQAPEEKGASISDPFDGTPYRMRRPLASGLKVLDFGIARVAPGGTP